MKTQSWIKVAAVAIVLAFLGAGTYLYAGEYNLVEPIEKTGILLENGAKSGLAVLPYTYNSDDGNPGITSISDLNANASLFDGTITGIDAGAGLMGLTANAKEDYNLSLNIMISSEAGMLAALDGAKKSGEHIVVTMWDPHWANVEYGLKYLEDPKGSYGEAESIMSYARHGLKDDDKDLTDILGRYSYESVEFNGLLKYIEEEGKKKISIEVATETWLAENPSLKTKWIGDVEAEHDRGTIKIGLVGWACAMGSSNVLKHILESVGYTVELMIVDAGVMFAGLAYGIIDLTTTVWMPLTHEQYLAKYGPQDE